MYYIISDLNFCNTEVAHSLGFVDAKEMNDIIIEKWNEVITDDAKVFIFGTVFDRATQVSEIRSILSKLKGELHLGSFAKNKYLSKSIWKNLGFTAVWDCKFTDKVFINGVKETVNFITRPKEKPVGYCCVDKDNLDCAYQDKKLCMAAEYWDFTPIVVSELGTLFENMIEFEKMSNE